VAAAGVRKTPLVPCRAAHCVGTVLYAERQVYTPGRQLRRTLFWDPLGGTVLGPVRWDRFWSPVSGAQNFQCRITTFVTYAGLQKENRVNFGLLLDGAKIKPPTRDLIS
jgi:hypothetical protein